ncbi:MAG: TIGR02757 family protein [Cyclobacteriaceae bacterium]|nr:TIGR02757 family protein [Cyclobacteriaceae bacterium]MDH4296918.1 TIGR02757 family protein [Cyclobacteriaceae bacterium]MDH5248173.1 TIGR02757 family protein [Cyclobacteriaceae bacterium]
MAISRKLKTNELKDFLDQKAEHYNKPGFIVHDPISIPHAYSKKQDIEIAGLFAAILAWGKRVTIVRKCKELLQRMDNAPYQFISQHKESDLKAFEDFKHRTFNSTDTLYFIEFLRWFYDDHQSLEEAFMVQAEDKTVENGLIQFHNLFFSLDAYPNRTKKHIATPERRSTCKRLNMYLRWMVRSDNCGVDFGIWNKISPSQLICPCDVHVERVARKLRLIKRKQTDWITATELTSNLLKLDPIDPVKYDFALFGLGIEEGWSKKEEGIARSI